MHPLYSEDLTQLSDDELHKKHGEVLRRIAQASRLGYVGAIQQMQLILDHFSFEIQRRNNEKMKKMMENDKNFDSYIDIK
jgi:hypothetical protein